MNAIKTLRTSVLATAAAMSLATAIPTTVSAYTFPPGGGHSNCCHWNGGHSDGEHGWPGPGRRFGDHDGGYYHGGYWGGFHHGWGYGGGYGYPVSYDVCPPGFFRNYWGHCRPIYTIRPF